MTIELIIEIISSVLGASGLGIGGTAFVKHKSTQRNNVELEARLVKLETIQDIHKEQFEKIENKLDKIFDLVRDK